MTTINLGLAVTSNAGTAAVDLDKLVVSADKAEKGAKRVGGASREMAAALGSITAILTNIERHTATMAVGLNKSATAALSLGTASGTVAASLRSMDTVTAKITMNMTGMKTSVTSVSAAINQEASALNGATSALIENTRAANENKSAMASRTAISGKSSAGLNNFNTSNVAAQFQDIGVTSAMGMSPMMIALQQGTQLSAVLGGQGLTGVVRTLGSAFASVFSPVSLLTIGVVGLGAAGIQALMGMMNSTDDATSSLEEHSRWLDKVLVGYKDARDAAQSVSDAAEKLPRGVALQNLQGGIDVSKEKLLQLTDNAAKSQENLNVLTQQWVDLRKQSQEIFPDDLGRIARFDTLISQSGELSQLSVSANSTAAELGNVMTKANGMMQSASEPAIKNLLHDIYNLADGLRSAQGELNDTTAAFDRMQTAMISGSFSQLTGLTDAMEALKSATPDLRTASERVTAIYNANSGSDVSGDLKKQLDYTLSQIKAEEDLRNSRKGATAGAKSFDQWGSATGNFQKRIDQQQMEIGLLGQSTFAIERQRAAFDLLNQAKSAGIPITSTVTDQINTMSSQYASATVELERQIEVQKAADEQMNFYRGTFTGLFSDMKSGLKEGQSFWESMGNAGANALDKIADRALSMAANGLFDMIFGSVMGGITGGMGGGLGAGGAGFLGGGASSWGPSFAGGGYTGSGARTGGLDGQGGFMAMMHPRETVTDHTRSTGAANQNQSSNSASGDINITNHMQVMPGATEADGAAFARGVTRELRKQLPDAIEQHRRNPLRRVS